MESLESPSLFIMCNLWRQFRNIDTNTTHEGTFSKNILEASSVCCFRRQRVWLHAQSTSDNCSYQIMSELII